MSVDYTAENPATLDDDTVFPGVNPDETGAARNPKPFTSDEIVAKGLSAAHITGEMTAPTVATEPPANFVIGTTEYRATVNGERRIWTFQGGTTGAYIWDEIALADSVEVLQTQELHRARMNRVAAFSNTANTDTIIPYDTIVHNVGGIADAAAGKMTIVNPGYYWITSGFRHESTGTNNTQAQVWVDGVKVDRGGDSKSSGGGLLWAKTSGFEMYLDAGAVIEGAIFAEASGALATAVGDQAYLQVTQMSTQATITSDALATPQAQYETLTYAATAVESVSFTHDKAQSASPSDPGATQIYMGDINIVRRYLGNGQAHVSISGSFIQGSGSTQDSNVTVTLPTGTLTTPFIEKPRAFRNELNVSAYVLLNVSADQIVINRDDNINNDSTAYFEIEGIGNWVGDEPTGGSGGADIGSLATPSTEEAASTEEVADELATRDTTIASLGTAITTLDTELNNVEAKTDHISVTQPVDLDEIETRVNQLDAAVVLKGVWDASAGTFPTSTKSGESWIVSVAGTVDGIDFELEDRVIAITDSASTTTYAANWHKADYTDKVVSVNGQTGAVTAATVAQGALADSAVQPPIEYVTVTGTTHTISTSEINKMLVCTNVAGCTITIPKDISGGFNLSAIPTEDQQIVYVIQDGVGVIGNAYDHTKSKACKYAPTSIGVISNTGDNPVVLLTGETDA